MTDTPAEQPNDPKTVSSDNGAEQESANKKEVPPGMLPLVAPAFGKHAFLITAVPFLIYLVGTSFGAYLETTRKTTPVHNIRGECRSRGKVLQEVFDKADTDAAKNLVEAIDLAGVREALDDEAADVETLVQKCDKLLQFDLEQLTDPQTRGAIELFQNYVKHFLELESMMESNDLDKIRPAYIEFLKVQHPDTPEEELPKLNNSWYPTLYSIACILALIAVLVGMPGYLKHPFRITPFALGVGVVGIFVWIGLWWLDKNFLGIGEYFAPNSRAAFNPFVELAATPGWMYGFLTIRLVGLCLVIPIAEEFFARGFLIRYIEDIDWDQIPIGEVTWKGLAGILAYGAMTHPGEVVAALAWFGLITWMFLKTKNIWDCVVAHAVTNALLAVFVITTNTWELW